ncbi:phosphate signaling complex protein PhoU [Mycobacterium avium]|uniref:phosphate signaling complex protein PhoU n=1 Tax=Mycobacterium avium TaxID=1764 RepID=UPI0001B5A0CC|nr:phosphate signaling complex protein PhoU [Mycobacterium avium]ETB02911.1 PhoU family transcriptional regulator [Mycobacterium avium subsp. silvaticum ATCC 49884]ETB12615.1 PhoU family transcriptional regulator [Mycobacterium avium subsp. avium 10-9275]ETB18105.1 PhoU family transcriptional regulator [Mycobacterium avium subsp. avium 11-4751]ANR91857.1 phosphate transport system regulatory protein PhoU [Mycobacterium avium]AYJ03479.1 phosphate transport system regulatory protein PhoU [Mycoba
MRSGFHRRLCLLNARLAEMCAMAADAIAQATHALLDADLLRAEGVITRQHSIAALGLQAEETAFALLALQAPVATDLRAVVSALRIAADAQRMVELAVHVAEIARRRHPDSAVPAEVRPIIAAMGEAAEALAAGAREVLLSQDPRRAAQIRRDDDTMDELHRRLLSVLMDPAWTPGVAAAVDATLLGRFYERFADHAVEIARRVIFQATGR